MNWRSSLYSIFLPSPAGKIRRDHAGAEPGLWKDAIFGRISLETNSEWKPPENRGPSPQPSEKRNFIFQSHGIFSGFCSLLVSGRVSPPRVELLMENSNIFAAQYWLPEKLSANFWVGECHTTTTPSQTHSVGMTGWYIEKLCVSLFEKSWGIHNCLDRRPSYPLKFGPNWTARARSTWKTSTLWISMNLNPPETSHPVASKKRYEFPCSPGSFEPFASRLQSFWPFNLSRFFQGCQWSDGEEDSWVCGPSTVDMPDGWIIFLLGKGVTLRVGHVVAYQNANPGNFHLPIIFFRCKPPL